MSYEPSNIEKYSIITALSGIIFDYEKLFGVIDTYNYMEFSSYFGRFVITLHIEEEEAGFKNLESDRLKITKLADRIAKIIDAAPSDSEAASQLDQLYETLKQGDELMNSTEMFANTNKRFFDMSINMTNLNSTIIQDCLLAISEQDVR